MSRNLIEEFYEIIDKNKSMYIMAIMSLAFVFLAFATFMVFTLNIYKANENLKDDYMLTVLLKNSTKENSLNIIESEILGVKGVRNVHFISKQKAISDLEEEMGMVVKEAGKFILSSFEVHFSKEITLEEMEEKLLNISGVKNIIYEKELFEEIDEKIAKNEKLINFLKYITIIPFVISLFGILLSGVLSQKGDIIAKRYLGLRTLEILSPYYLVNLVKYSVGSILGSLMFLNLYEYFIRNVVNGDSRIVVSTEELATILMIAVGTSTLLLPISSIILSSVSVKGR